MYISLLIFISKITSDHIVIYFFVINSDGVANYICCFVWRDLFFFLFFFHMFRLVVFGSDDIIFHCLTSLACTYANRHLYSVCKTCLLENSTEQSKKINNIFCNCLNLHCVMIKGRGRIKFFITCAQFHWNTIYIMQ